MIQEQYRLKNTIKYPTSLIVGGLSRLGLEIVDSLIEQGGYVIIVDNYSDENIAKLNIFPKGSLVSFIDYTTLAELDEELRRLDYIFYFDHESLDYMSKISTQNFLKFSNYLDNTLNLANKFGSKFLLTTAIRAHQLSLSYDDLSAKYGVDSKERHTVYTEMEVQRYAESLVMEYSEKTNLDARIVRLGEIIGEGLDFSTKTFFTDLMIRVVEKQPLKLSKDGLESEWLVHLMDAAYGIIKAQFSANTKGEIFSIAYPNPFTHLSIAYKVQELEADAKEIQFVDEDDNLPEIRLYKPAPNLSAIGWTPKIPIDKAITQSVAAAKIYLLETQTNKVNPSQDNVIDKLKSFMSLADKEESKKDQYGGPISRLIAERKKQEELKMQSITNANNNVQSKKISHNKTLKEKISNKIWNFSTDFGNTFTLFKNKSPGQIVTLLFLFVIFFLFFFGVFSPSVLIGRDLISILPFYNNTFNSIDSSNYSTGNLHADTLSSSLKDIQENLESFNSEASILGLNNEFSQFKNMINAYQVTAEGLSNIQYSLEPFYDYLNNFQNNTQVRSGTDGYLSTSTSNTNYQNYLEELVNRQPYLTTGIEKYQKGLGQAQKVDMSVLPGFLVSGLVNMNLKLKQYETGVQSLESVKYLPEILGLNSKKTYLILLQDSTRIKPIGGETAAFLLVTLDNGAITKTTLQSPDSVKFDYKSIDQNTLDEINKRSLTAVSKDHISYSNLENISDYSVFSNSISKIFNDTFDQKISGVLSINYQSFSELLDILKNNGNDVSVEGLNYEKDNFLSQLGKSQIGNSTLSAKHEISAHIMAQTINLMFNNISGLFPQIITSFHNSALTQGILFNSSDLEYESFVKSNSLNGIKSSKANSFYSLGYNLEDPTMVSLDRYLNFNVSDEIRIDSNLGLTYKTVVQVPVFGSAQRLSICLPSSVKKDKVTVKGIESYKVSINEYSDETCAVAQILDEKSVEFDWAVNPKLKSNSDGNYNATLNSMSIRGADTNLDQKIVFEPDLILTSFEPVGSKQNDSLVYNQTINPDFSVNLSIKKQ